MHGSGHPPTLHPPQGMTLSSLLSTECVSVPQPSGWFSVTALPDLLFHFISFFFFKSLHFLNLWVLITHHLRVTALFG